MTREDARKAAEVMLAYADGEEIESGSSDRNLWSSIDNPSFNWVTNDYRIKPTPTYRPFANAEECWEEMKKHQPFGWVKYQYRGICLVGVGEVLYAGANVTYEEAFNDFTFADGTPFGKLTEEEG